MLAGILGTSILSGILAVGIAILCGQHPLLWPLSYWLAGSCGVLGFILHALRANPELLGHRE